MPVSASSFTILKSETVTSAATNGGRMGREAVSSARHGLLPRVSRAQREAGDTVLRKVFLANLDPDDQFAYGVLLYPETPTPAGDRCLMALGTQTDQQGDLDGDYLWVGCGKLAAPLSGGETQITLDMESADARFPNGGVLRLANQFKAAQTVDAAAAPGDAVEYDSPQAKWLRVDQCDEIAFPKGVFLGGGLVMTDDAAHEEWLDLAENLRTNVVLAAGNGSATQPVLADLTLAANPVCAQPGKRPLLTATCGGQARAVLVAADGSCSGYCSAGQLNMATGQWTTDVVWTTAPDNATNITITYRESCFRYSGSQAVAQLASQVANAYSVANTYAAGCLSAGDVGPTWDGWAESSVGDGTYDESTTPPQLFNDGVEEETWTLTFTSATAFTASGARAGTVGSGDKAADFAPVNPATGQPYFKLKAAGWAGTWAAGDVAQFATHPGSAPVWVKRVVPAGTAQAPDNCFSWGWYNE